MCDDLGSEPLKQPVFDHFPAFDDAFRVIEVEDFDSCCTNLGFRNDPAAGFGIKMVVPIIFPGIEKTNAFYGEIEKGKNICAFMEIADLAGIRQVCLLYTSPSPRD